MPTLTIVSKHKIHPFDMPQIFRDIAAITESFDGLDLDNDPVTVFFPCGSLHSTLLETHTHVVIDELRVKMGYRDGRVCHAYGESIAAYLLEQVAHVAYHTVTMHIRSFEGRNDIVHTVKKEFVETPVASES